MSEFRLNSRKEPPKRQFTLVSTCFTLLEDEKYVFFTKNPSELRNTRFAYVKNEDMNDSLAHVDEKRNRKWIKTK